MVFYRKYRPQKISELDSENVRNSLYAIFSKKDTAHAFLFSGPKGLGKTSAARIVAKVINCEKHSKILNRKSQISKLAEKEIEPDNKCSQCISITNGTNLDVLEIDGASNRGIDEIRDLKEKINLLPTRASKKIYIIDEVHMLTTEAFNALLKTLEEPPPHAVFILCTTELHKLPKTIVSRCFRVDFKKATNEEIARSLLRIVKGEGIKIDKDVLFEIAKMSDESFREAAKILEELALKAGKKTITRQFLQENYNTLGIDKQLEEFANALSQKDINRGFDIIGKLSEQGIDFRFFIEQLLERFHLELISKLEINGGTGGFELLEIKRMLELLAKAHMETKFAVLPQLPLELMLVEWSGNGALEQQNDNRGPVSLHPRPTSSSTSRRTAGARRGPPALATPGSEFSNTFINEVKNYNHLIAGVLRSCDIETPKQNVLEIHALSKFHKEKLEEEKTMLILEEAAKKLLSKKVKIYIILK